MSYHQRQQRLTQALRNTSGQGIRLSKQTSNLFRNRSTQGQVLDVHEFNHVLAIDPVTRIIETEGMVTYEALVDASLRQGLMPAVVPQLKSITIGGAVSGIGIESSSFRYGLPHETVLEMDVLLGTGEVICCTPNNEHRDLFFGLANSYGTLGYILRLKIQGIPVKPYVRLTHVRCADSQEFFDRALTKSVRGHSILSTAWSLLPGSIISCWVSLLMTRPTPVITATCRFSIDQFDRVVKTTSACAIICGAGTPTGSGVRKTCMRRIA